MSTIPVAATPEPVAASTSAGPGLLRRIWHSGNGRIGLVAMAVLIVIAVLGALGLLPHDPIEQHPAQRLQGPSGQYWFGTDQFGRDIAARVAVGIWTSLRVAVASVAVAAVLGSILGIAAGFFRGWVDQVVSRLVDILFAFPAILLALALIAVLGSNARNVVLAIGLVYIPIFARTARAAVLTVKYREFVDATRALGASALSIYLRHILPNAMAPILVQATLSISTAILAEAALSFLGVGTQPPTPSWGGMLSESRAFMEVAPWTAVFPGLAIMVAVLSFNVFGDGIRDYLDPRLRNL